MAEVLRVLVVATSYEPSIGGSSTFQWELTRRIAQRGHTVHVLTPRLKGLPRTERKEGVLMTRLGPEGKVNRASFTLLATIHASRILRSYDIILGETFVGAIPSAMAARICNRPSILTVYEVFDNQWTGYLPNRRVLAESYKLVEKNLLRLQHDQYVALSNYTGKRLVRCGIDPKKIKVVPPGIDYGFWENSLARPERFRETQGIGERQVYSSFGRSGISKGFDYLLAAAKLVAAQRPDSRLYLVLNEGDLFAGLVRMIARSKDLREHVILGKSLTRTELRDVIAGSTFVVVPSLSEGFGFAVAETCALGTPIVATNAGSIPEVISGKHRLVEPANSIALAKAIVSGLDGLWNKTPNRRFEWDTTVDRYENLIREQRASV